MLHINFLVLNLTIYAMHSDGIQLWPDEKLLELIRADDCAAFDVVYAKYWSKLYTAAFNILRDRQAAEDIVQEVLVSLWLRRDSLEIGSLSTYLYASVRYQVFKVIRSGKIRESFFLEVKELSVGNQGENALIQQDISNLLDEGVSSLPEKCRQVFLLSRKEHLTTKEIAQRLGLAPKTVENQLTIAFRRLRAVLGDFILRTVIVLVGWWL